MSAPVGKRRMIPMRSRSLFGGCLPSGRLPCRLASMLAPAFLAVALGCGEDAQSPAGPDGGPALATAAAVATLPFLQVSAGVDHTCGVARDNRAYCWGPNNNGQLGDGTTKDRSRPVAVARGLRFSQVNAGSGYTCGVTTDSLVYCWGRNDNGQLGIGALSQRVRPVPVAGGRRFRQVDAGYDHTCAVTPSDVAF